MAGATDQPLPEPGTMRFRHILPRQGDKPHVLVLTNFHAGSSDSRLSSIFEALTTWDVHLELAATSAGRITLDNTPQLAVADLVVAIGGDGTLSLVAAALYSAGLDTPLAYIPSGTTCDFARSLNFPSDPVDLILDLPEAEVCHMDLGRFNEQTFVYVASFGAFTAVATETDPKLKRSLGHVAYILEGLRSPPAIKPIPTVFVQDGISYERDLIFGAISNSRSIGGLLKYTEEQVDFTDGLLETMLIKLPDNPLETPQMLQQLLNANFNSPSLRFISTQRISFTFDHPVSWTLDGEPAGEHLEVTIDCLPHALPMLLPAALAICAD